MGKVVGQMMEDEWGERALALADPSHRYLARVRLG